MLLSMISMRTKEIVCSLNLHPEKISLDTRASCNLEIRFSPFIICVAFEKFEKRNAERELVEIERPEKVGFYVTRIVDYRTFEGLEYFINGTMEQDYQWENGTFEVRDYIDHFMEILHHDWIDELSVMSDDAYPPEEIQQLVNGLDIRLLSFSDEGNVRISDDDMIIYLNAAVKPTRCFYLDKSPLFAWNHTRMSQFFIQNLDYIVIGDAPLLTLDDLLLMNISEIQINSSWMIEKDFNRFLKHWIAGSNPRLKYLTVGDDSTIDDREEFERELLNGIDHRKMADEEERTCIKRMGTYEECREKMTGGSYIRRKDGTEAIVHAEYLRFHLILQELVNF
ncbi:hypothetical protein GCK72_009155 [Caenorhabditis remanei]|uniref:Sdz-33 F-box domain-containing protein n=1 Tax=Caenorhabditis remanei TaxID=31234 RepID=A0A6A5H2Z3_CAERE|nr:hypothetical protein GCK72_009155 [Caenorhabditis remanei]KAF1760903.1 hypothetical protein GCK72_009155 [Caenorhabditis remanei]